MSDLADEHGGHHRVLVAGVGALEVAVALLEAQHEGAVALLLVVLDDLTDELEAG